MPCMGNVAWSVVPSYYESDVSFYVDYLYSGLCECERYNENCLITNQ